VPAPSSRRGSRGSNSQGDYYRKVWLDSVATRRRNRERQRGTLDELYQLAQGRGPNARSRARSEDAHADTAQARFEARRKARASLEYVQVPRRSKSAERRPPRASGPTAPSAIKALVDADKGSRSSRRVPEFEFVDRPSAPTHTREAVPSDRVRPKAPAS
jgi:hypothetical protein